MTSRNGASATLVLMILGACGNGVNYTDMCESPSVRKMALDAVEQKIVLAGLPTERSFASAFAKLKPIRNQEKVRTIRQSMRIPSLDDMQVCGPDGDERQLTTIIIRRDGHRIGGVVLNFGIPGAQAPFGDMDD